MPDRLIALFGPTGVGKTAVALALAERLRKRGEDPVAISADALQVYEGLETLTGAADRRTSASGSSTAWSGSCRSARASRWAPTRRWPTARSTPRSQAGRRPIVVGGTGLYLRAALTDLALPAGAAGGAARAARGPRAQPRARPRSTPSSQSWHRPRAATIEPTDSTRVVRALELLEMGEEPAAAGEDSELWTGDTRHPTLLCGLVREREDLYARIDARVDAMVAAGAVDEVRRADAAGASRTARSALGFEELLAGDVEGMKRRTRNYAKRQLTWMRKLPNVRLIDLTGRDPDDAAAEIESAAVKFEKWQALGNDYAIVEERELPFDLTPERVRALCAPHTGIGSDGVLLLSETDERGFVAELRIFNPDGSEAELSGQRRARGRDVPAPERLGRQRHLLAQDRRRRGAPAHHRRHHVHGGHGPGQCSADRRRETGTLTAAGREWSFQFVSIGNPQCAIEVAEGLEELDLQEVGPPIESHELFPNRTNVSFWRPTGDSEIRARIFERGVGETMSSGTGATGAAVAAVLGGVDSPVTVHLDGGDLEVEVGEDLHVNLTGWAVPVYSGRAQRRVREGAG